MLHLALKVDISYAMLSHTVKLDSDRVASLGLNLDVLLVMDIAEQLSPLHEIILSANAVLLGGHYNFLHDLW